MNRQAAFALSAAVFILDRITKIAIERAVSAWDTRVIIPNVLNIVYTRNRGAAFGILNDAPDAVRSVALVGVSVAILGAIGWMLWREFEGRLPLALIFGGALGNLFDRLTTGSVTDFVQVFIGSYEWPSFNVADSAITIGACLIALDLLRNRRYAPQAH